MTELKPCPFCGGVAALGNYIMEACVQCSGCGTKVVRRHSPTADTGVPDAIAAWNTRALTKADEILALVSSERDRMREALEPLKLAVLQGSSNHGAYVEVPFETTDLARTWLRSALTSTPAQGKRDE